MAGPTASRWWPSRIELLAAAAVFVAVAGIVQPLLAQQASRMALTAAVADRGTVRIDDYTGALGVDFASKDGHVFSDKAPAQPVFAVPFYLAYRAVGGEPAEELRVDGNLGLWWASVWSAALPAAILVILMARLARAWSERWSIAAGLAMGSGTLLFPFGSLLFSHTASAALVAGALLTWRGSLARAPDLVATGALLGAAIAVEYTCVVALAVVGLATMARDRLRGGWWVGLGAAGPIVLLMGYHWLAFGSPFDVPYRHHNLGLHNSAVAGLKAPNLEVLWTLATNEKGLFLLTPVALLGVIGLVLAARDRPDRRAELTVIAAVFLGFAVVQAGAADLTGGDSLGPRYVIPGLPGLVVGLAHLWERSPRLCAITAGVSTAVMVLATYTEPLISVKGEGVIAHWLEELADGAVVRTVLEPVLGPWGALPFLGGAAGLAWMALRNPVPPAAATD